MTRFVRKQVVVEAVRLTEGTRVETTEGVVQAQPGDWMITNVKGEKHSCKHDIFMENYDPVPRGKADLEGDGFERSETVDHPPHYHGGDNAYETIKVVEAWNLGFCLGNVVKYVSRAMLKGNPVEDLEKALWYLKRELERVKADE